MLRRPVVLIDGEYQELPQSDGLDGVIVFPSPILVRLRFGPKARREQTFIVPEGKALLSHRVQVFSVPDSDEYEMDHFTCSGYVKYPGILVIHITTHPGPVIGERQFAYILHG